jgi:EAL domain-containing protein (putative c-di-GMP-specific phosphodiesterase class I)
MTEHTGGLKRFKHHIRPCRPHKLKIAVDDIDATASQIDHILALEPEIIKLDMHIFKIEAKGQTKANIVLFFANLTQRQDIIMCNKDAETVDECHFYMMLNYDLGGCHFSPFFLSGRQISGAQV